MAASPTSIGARWFLTDWALWFICTTERSTWSLSTGRNKRGKNYNNGDECFHGFTWIVIKTYDYLCENISSYHVWRVKRLELTKDENEGILEKGNQVMSLFMPFSMKHTISNLITRTRLVMRQSRGRNHEWRSSYSHNMNPASSIKILIANRMHANLSISRTRSFLFFLSEPAIINWELLEMAGSVDGSCTIKGCEFSNRRRCELYPFLCSQLHWFRAA